MIPARLTLARAVLTGLVVAFAVALPACAGSPGTGAATAPGGASETSSGPGGGGGAVSPSAGSPGGGAGPVSPNASGPGGSGGPVSPSASGPGGSGGAVSPSPSPGGPGGSGGASSGGAAPITGSLAGRDWTYIPTSRNVVALTFDAGANADAVPSILATLRSAGVPATFFLTGDFVRTFPAASRSIAAAGMRIGDHTITHPYLTKLSDAAVTDQITGAARQISAVTGANPAPLFRFPFGDTDARTIRLANQVGYVPVRWTVDTLGWEGTAGHISAAVVISRVLTGLRPGEIVLMHVGSNPDDRTTFDADALPALISELKARGYGFVTLDALSG